MKTSAVQVGMRVTCKVAQEAYYSGYGGSDYCRFFPGMVGVVAAIEVPGVRTGRYFVCVDFYDEAVYNHGAKDEADKHLWRVSLFYDNIVIVKAITAEMIDATSWPLPG